MTGNVNNMNSAAAAIGATALNGVKAFINVKAVPGETVNLSIPEFATPDFPATVPPQTFQPASAEIVILYIPEPSATIDSEDYETDISN